MRSKKEYMQSCGEIVVSNNQGRVLIRSNRMGAGQNIYMSPFAAKMLLDMLERDNIYIKTDQRSMFERVSVTASTIHDVFSVEYGNDLDKSGNFSYQVSKLTFEMSEMGDLKWMLRNALEDMTISVDLPILETHTARVTVECGSCHRHVSLDAFPVEVWVFEGKHQSINRDMVGVAGKCSCGSDIGKLVRAR